MIRSREGSVDSFGSFDSEEDGRRRSDSVRRSSPVEIKPRRRSLSRDRFLSSRKISRVRLDADVEEVEFVRSITENERQNLCRQQININQELDFVAQVDLRKKLLDLSDLSICKSATVFPLQLAADKRDSTKRLVNAIAEMLEKDECCIEVLFLTNNAASDNLVRFNNLHLQTILGACKSLRYLSLSGHKFKSKRSGYNFESAHALRDLLKRGDSDLEVLYLDDAKIDDDIFKIICDGLKDNKKLKRLFLRNNEVGVDGYAKLTETLRKNTSLEIINLAGNKPIPQDIKGQFDNLAIPNGDKPARVRLPSDDKATPSTPADEVTPFVAVEVRDDAESSSKDVALNPIDQFKKLATKILEIPSKADSDAKTVIIGIADRIFENESVKNYLRYPVCLKVDDDIKATILPHKEGYQNHIVNMVAILVKLVQQKGNLNDAFSDFLIEKVKEIVENFERRGFGVIVDGATLSIEPTETANGAFYNIAPPPSTSPGKASLRTGDRHVV